MIKEATKKISARMDLTAEETAEVFDEIMSGKAEHDDIKLFLDALRKKGETVTEITAAARVIREKSVRIDAGNDLLDTCGTGGSGINTFNISTAAAFVVAGCGVKIAKHGNRSASSMCGSADVLETLGVKIDIPPEATARCIKEIGVGFMFAPMFHSAMKYAALPRKELGVKTIFNILGPLSNPAGASYQVAGVYSERLTEVMANVLKNLGTKRAFIVHGLDGLDEITVTDNTKVSELRDGSVSTYEIKPEDFGLKRSSLEEIKGEEAKGNAKILLSVLKDDASPAHKDVVLANASACLVCAGKSVNFKEGVKIAGDAIKSGAAFEKLSKLIEFTNK